MRIILLALAVCLSIRTLARAEDRPNIVLIGAEDISPSLGCYGDPDAITPNLDRLAAQGARFTRAFTHAPVCAPSRSGLITGMYPTTIGTHHMRSRLVQPPRTFVDELRAAGYFVAWPSGPLGKTDFNFEVRKGWVDSAADWTKRPETLPEDRPWFAYVNYTVTHESKARASRKEFEEITARLRPSEHRDRAKLTLPPYFPDTPAVRECVGKYHDNLTALDYAIGDLMKVVDALPHPENTAVVFFGDHGWGLSRGKRWCYDSGTRIPLLVRWPEKIKPGTVRDDLVCLLDVAPTLLALAGVKKPGRMVGRVFLGKEQDPPPTYVFSARDRMDEAYDRIRSARGVRYRYIRNFHPELPYAQYINYMDEMPIMRDWRRLAFEGNLNDAQRAFFARTKPPEELYDLDADPYEIRNLAGSPEHRATLGDMRTAVDCWIVKTSDLGDVPEKELIRRGLVKDLLSTEYEDRVRQHPASPPVP